MTREYGKVLPAFWIGETGRLLRGDHLAQVVALYLVTGPHASPLGIYHLSIPTLAHDIGSPLEGASEALRRVKQAHFALYDEAAEVVWVPEMARIQLGDQIGLRDNRHRWICREASCLPKCVFLKDFYEKYGEAYNLPLSMIGRAISQAPSKGLGRGSEAPYSMEQEQEQEQEQQEKNPPTPHPPSSDPPSPEAGSGAEPKPPGSDSDATQSGRVPTTNGKARGHRKVDAEFDRRVERACEFVLAQWGEAVERQRAANPEGRRWTDHPKVPGPARDHIRARLRECAKGDPEAGRPSEFAQQFSWVLTAVEHDDWWTKSKEGGWMPNLNSLLIPAKWDERVARGMTIERDEEQRERAFENGVAEVIAKSRGVSIEEAREIRRKEIEDYDAKQNGKVKS